ncbi:TRAP transporter substrate-binding protein [Leisingera methylohalidivorans]|uniref:ABC transporter substrate-binding protein n=1 Tax=Leisingera methylohalidivorans DSM 14336 TaxID=999552 RepID=V9VTH9_9RHOB|nr:TRAP transporter substrate-binding protein [Leisingera methylohalidivorans]AHD02046.1 ABC transporter substrate-binding protein [Leisingera methylohalidivorans DSM 14336]
MTFPFYRPLTRATLAAGLCLSSTVAMADTVLTMSSWAPATSTLSTEFLDSFAADVARVTDDRVTVRILPAALGAPPQHYELARKGIADITWGNLTYEPERFKVMWFCELPMSGESGEAGSIALWRTFDTYLKDMPVFDGTHMLAVSLFGGADVHDAHRALVTPEDFRNQKIRMGNPLQKTLLEKMGAIPVAAPATKAFELIDSGVIDGSLHPIESIIGFGLQDALPFTTEVEGGLYDAMFFLAINQGKWDSISDEDRAAISEITGEALSAKWGAFWDGENATAREKLVAMGHTFATPEPALTDMIRKVRTDFLDQWYADGPDFGLPNAKEVVVFFESNYAEISEAAQ